MDEIIARVSDAMPKLNRYLLKDFTTQQIAKTPEYIKTVFVEAIKLFGGLITFVDYEVLSPEARVAFEAGAGAGKKSKGISVARSNLQLVAYHFRYRNQSFTTHLYLPYLFQDMIVLHDKRYAIQRGVTERVFSRTPTGVTVRVIRAPLQFNRTEMFRMISAATGDFTMEFVYGCQIYLDPRNRSRKGLSPTIMHYLLCKFGFVSTMQQFGLTEADIGFCQAVGEDTEEYDYFVAKKPSRHNDLYLRVRKSALADPLYRKVAANVLYILTHFNFQTIEHLYDPRGLTFRQMLGRILRPNDNDPAAIAHVDAHMFSVDIYVDELSRNRINEFGVAINDAYDLLRYVFIEMDRIQVNTADNGLYNSRIDINDGLLGQTMVRKIYNRFYFAHKRIGKLNERDIATLFNMPPMMIGGIYASDNVITPTIYGASGLNVACLKLRQTGQYGRQANPQAQESRFHPSFVVVESIGVFSGKNPGVTGLINPCLPITAAGGVIKPNYADQLDGLRKILPYR